MGGFSNVKCDLVDGNQVFKDKSGNEIVTIDGTNRSMRAPSAGIIGVTGLVDSATITVSAEGATVANRRDITIQLVDVDGNDITSRAEVEIRLLADANGDAYLTTPPSTGLAIGTDGALTPEVMVSGQTTNKFKAISESDGDIDLTWTDTGTVAAYLAIKLPNGSLVISSALTNA